MPKLSGNKGEWSEIYVFLRALAVGKLYAADENLNKVDDVFYNIINIVRNENIGVLEFRVDKVTNMITVYNTMALENDIDIKTLSTMIGHISAETTLNIYSHITDTMQQQAAVRIDLEIGGTDAQMPEVKQTHEQSTNTPVNAQYEPAEPHLVPVPRKIRKSGTGCIYQINDHLWEGSFYPRLPNGKRKKFNVYAETREQCEAKLAEMIAEKKAEIAEEKAKRKEGAD